MFCVKPYNYIKIILNKIIYKNKQKFEKNVYSENYTEINDRNITVS